MEPAIRRFRIQAYKAQLAKCELVHAALAKELKNLTLTRDQRFVIGLRWDDVQEERRVLQVAIEQLEKAAPHY
jgi:hypothetical protein